MATSRLPTVISQQQLQSFVTKYRLQRAKLDDVWFYMNPDFTQNSAWLTQMQPTGSGYVRWSFGAQPITIRLDGTTGSLGFDSGDDTLGGMKQLYSKFSPSSGTIGNDNQLKRRRFYYPAMELYTEDAYIDSFQRSITSQHPLYYFFTIQLTILPPRIARDYATYVPPVPNAALGFTGNPTTSNVLHP